MARLQKKHFSKEKNKKKEIKDLTEDKKGAKVILSGAKNITSSSKKGNSVKGSSATGQADKKNIFQQGIEYLQEVQSELKKVTWPTRKQTMGTTLVVIVLVAIVSIFLGLFDMGFSKLIQAVLA